MIDAALPLQVQPPQITSALSLLNQRGALQQQQANIADTQQQTQQRGLQNQSDSIKLGQQQQGVQDQADSRAATAAAIDPATGKVDRGVLLSTLAKLNPTVAAQTEQTLKAQDTAAQEAQTKSQAAQLALAEAHVNAKDKLLSGVNDQITYTNAVNSGIQAGIVKPGELPDQYNPQLVAQLHAQTLTQQQQIANMQAAQKEKDAAAQAAATLANTSAHQKVEEQQGNQRLSIESRRLNQENTGTLSIAQVPDGKGGMKSVMLNNKTGAITDTNPGLTKPSATQPPAGQPTTADRNRASLGQIALDNINGIEDIVKRRSDLFGPGAGRVANIDQIVGSNDPDLVAVTNFAHNFSMANAGVHGSRSVQNVRDAVKDLLGDLHNGPQGIAGGLQANRANLQRIIDSGKQPGTTSPPSQAPAQNATPQTHIFSASAWQKANPRGDVQAAKVAAQQQGYQVQP